MKGIDLSENNEVVLKTLLSKGQVAKFNSLVRSIIIFGNSAYIPVDQLHGVLLTRSKANALEILNLHKDLMNYPIAASCGVSRTRITSFAEH